jgi:Tfp pilus assembly protein PilF
MKRGLRDYYAFLGVALNATESAIQAAVDQARRSCVRDRDLEKAAWILLDRERRQKYDAILIAMNIKGGRNWNGGEAVAERSPEFPRAVLTRPLPRSEGSRRGAAVTYRLTSEAQARVDEISDFRDAQDLSRICRARGHVVLALAYARRAFQLSRCVETLNTFGAALRRAGYAADAVRVLEESRSLDPSPASNKHAFVALAAALLDQRHFSRAEGLCGQVLRAAPQDSYAMKVLGRAHAMRGDRAGADAYFSEAADYAAEDSGTDALRRLRARIREMEHAGRLIDAAALKRSLTRMFPEG